MPKLFAAVLLLGTTYCPHEEPNCITPSDPITIDEPGDSPGSLWLWFDSDTPPYVIPLDEGEAYLCSLSHCEMA